MRLISLNNQKNDYPELGSPPTGPYISPTFNQNISYNDQIYGTMVCYNCLSILLIRHDWNYTRCGECQKVNKIPHRNNSSFHQSIYNIYNNSNNFYEDSINNTDLIGDIPYVYGVVNCPFCTTENKIRKEAKRITCYNCANSFSVNGYSNNKQNNVRETITKVIRTGEYIPIYQNNNCNCNNNSMQLLMLQRILQELKEKKKPSIAYPTIFADPYGFMYRDLIWNNRYGENNENKKIRTPLSYSQPKLKKETESNGFRITIRKKNKNENDENKLTKSASSAFEKVFFTNRLKDDFGKDK